MWVIFLCAGYRNGWHNVLALSYGVRHLLPVVALIGLFGWSSWAGRRRRRYTWSLLTLSFVAAAGAFAVDVRGEPQFRRVWLDDPTTCANRQSYYCTWWWWQPTNH
jgi:hypothetical protein